MKGTLGKDARCNSIGLEPNQHRLAMNSVEAVVRQKLTQIESLWAFKGVAGFPQGSNMIDGKRGYCIAAMIVGDELQCSAIRIEVDGIRINLAITDLILVYRVIAQQYASLFNGGVGQSLDRLRVRAKVFRRRGGASEDRCKTIESVTQRLRKRGPHLHQH